MYLKYKDITEKVIGERRIDFFVENKICVEIKAIINLESVHFAQARNYFEGFKGKSGLSPQIIVQTP